MMLYERLGTKLYSDKLIDTTVIDGEIVRWYQSSDGEMWGWVLNPEPYLCIYYKEMENTMYMNLETGHVDDYDGWWYVNEYGEEVNAVDLGEVVEVNLQNGEYVEAV